MPIWQDGPKMNRAHGVVMGWKGMGRGGFAVLAFAEDHAGSLTDAKTDPECCDAHRL
jgi:hypothetical protein